MIQLPDIRTPDEVRGGRNVRDGYQRGWGLRFHNLHDQIMKEPLFQKATAAGEWSLITRNKQMNLYLLITHYFSKLDAHNIVEFGSYRGGNALFMATLLRELYPAAKVYALDTYGGMPPTDATRDLHSAGDFGDSSLPALITRSEALGLTNLIPVQGLFEETFPSLSDVRFGLAHIDCDIYHAAKYCQEAVWPQMASGGYVVYDDADVSSCIGATEAAEDLILARGIHSEQVWPHWVFRAF